MPNLNPGEELSASSVKRPTRRGISLPNGLYLGINCTRGLPKLLVVEGNPAGSVQVSRVVLNCWKTLLQTLLERDTVLRTTKRYLGPETETNPALFEFCRARLMGYRTMLLLT